MSFFKTLDTSSAGTDKVISSNWRLTWYPGNIFFMLEDNFFKSVIAQWYLFFLFFFVIALDQTLMPQQLVDIQGHKRQQEQFDHILLPRSKNNDSNLPRLRTTPLK